MEQQSKGPVPYPYYSMALFGDPLTALQSRSGVVYRQALARTRREAQADLTTLQSDYGPTPFDLTSHQQQLAKATTPSDYLKLAKAWTVEGAQVTANRDALDKESGGLTGGLPTDVVSGKAQLEQQAQQLSQAKLWTDPEPAADGAAQTYLKQSYAAMLQQHATIASQVSSANQTLTARIQLSGKAQNLVGELPGMIQQYGQNTSDQQQFQQAQQALSSAGNDQQLQAAAGTLQSLYNSLYQAKQQAQQAAAQAAANASATSTTACLPDASSQPAQEIIVSETNQELWRTATAAPCSRLRSRRGCRASGRMSAPSTSSPSTRSTRWSLRGPHPASTGTRPRVVPMAMEFVSDGTFLHGAPWEPDGAMGPGSENGPYASHGCVHIPSTALPNLYNWANIGATVVVNS